MSIEDINIDIETVILNSSDIIFLTILSMADIYGTDWILDYASRTLYETTLLGPYVVGYELDATLFRGLIWFKAMVLFMIAFKLGAWCHSNAPRHTGQPAGHSQPDRP